MFVLVQENLPKLFHEIVQFDPDKLQNGGGSGFGLWITKSIVDLHGGRVFAHSEGEGTGCTFTVDIPATVQATPLDMPAKTPSETPETSLQVLQSSSASTAVSQFVGPPRRAVGQVDNTDEAEFPHTTRRRVLVVDDAPVSRRMLCRSLKHRFLTVEAVDGVDAVEQVRISMDEDSEDDRYCAILMDYEMPRMNGPAAVKAIRSLGFTGTIIGVTGNALPEDVEMFLSHGADEVLLKPVDVEVMLKTIDGKNANIPTRFFIIFAE